VRFDELQVELDRDFFGERQHDDAAQRLAKLDAEIAPTPGK
jgi:hypothetical protein